MRTNLRMRYAPFPQTVAYLILAMGFFSRLLGASTPEERKSAIERLEAATPSQESLDRRERSERFLRSKNVPINSHLPLIEDSKTAKPRTPREIAGRLLGCTVVAVVGETGEVQAASDLIKQFNAESLLTPKEREFLAKEVGDKQTQIQFSWQYERVWVLLWALGYVPDLSYPNAICEMPKLVALVKTASVESLVTNAKPKTFAEILDAADLIYRIHWAVRDAQLNKKSVPAGLDGGVVLERHAALNWLVGYMDQSWDEITTDT